VIRFDWLFAFALAGCLRGQKQQVSNAMILPADTGHVAEPALRADQ